MKKTLAIMVVGFLTSCGVAINSSNLTSNLTSNPSSLTTSSQPTSEVPNTPVLVVDEEYGVKTATAASLLTDALQSGGTLARRQRQMTEEEEALAVEKVHQYLGIMNQILANNPIQTVVIDSDRPEYAYKVVVTTTGLDGSTSIFIMYVNAAGSEEENSSSSNTSSMDSSTFEVSTSEVPETSIDEQSSVEESSITEESSIEESSSDVTESIADSQANRYDDDEDDLDDDDFDDEEDGEDEEFDDDYENEDEDLEDEDRDEYNEYKDRDLGEEDELGEVTTISGIAIVGDLEYQLLGFSKVEGDEVKTKYFLFLNENNWVRISSKTEDLGAESKYDIHMKANGERSRLSFKVEVEDDETEVSLFIKSEAGAPEMYRFQSELHEETGGQLVKIKARVGMEKFRAVVLIYVDPITGETVYNYRFEGSTNEYFKDGNRPYHEHNDDDEEDDED
jgi:hypothetical protein